MIVNNINDKTKILWQEWSEDAAGEPAILLTKYSDGVEIKQEGRTVLIASHELAVFIKELKKFL